jgi:protein-disulfide isomerase
MLTRRDFVMSGSALSALAAAGMLAGAAWAQTFSVLELEAKGPLDDIVLGSESAPVTIIEYASMTCPHCAAFEVQVFPKLKEKYIDTGKVRFIMRLYPTQPVPLSVAAFMLARCAGPDKFYPLIETLFQQQAKWVVREPLPPLLNIAKQAGFTQQSFDACLKDEALYKNVQQVAERGGTKFKVDSTPTFYINGKKYSGGMTIEELDKELAPLIKS